MHKLNKYAVCSGMIAFLQLLVYEFRLQSFIMVCIIINMNQQGSTAN